MHIKIKLFPFYIILTAIGFTSCKKEKYSIGELKSPANLVLTATVAGTNETNPAGDGSGVVAINITGDNVLTYNIDFGDGKTQLVPTGVVSHVYTAVGTHDYTITVNAAGVAGITSTISKTITVNFAFVIPADIQANLTGGSSKVWVCDKGAPGHFGVGPADGFAPIWYAADPNSRLPCSYDDEVTFTKAADNVLDIQVNNFGQSFATGFSAAFYGLSSAEDCRDINTGGLKRLSFAPASSASTPDNSTRIQFEVPGNGLIIFGTGGNVYEILTLSETNMTIRNIGVDGNAWYQKLKVKP